MSIWVFSTVLYISSLFSSERYRLSGLFSRDGQSRRRDCEVSVATAYEVDGTGFESCQGK